MPNFSKYEDVNMAHDAREPRPHSTCSSSFDQFVATIAALRAPGGCPWDREQTHESIAKNIIEEAYEAVDAIEAKDATHLREELGDVLLQVVLQSQIAADEGTFTIDEVCAEVNEKMIRRHPHVFGNATVENSSDVSALWDQVKLAEKSSRDQKFTSEERSGLLDGVPMNFPALMQAQKISRQAASVGFEWECVDAVWDKVNEEIAELKEAYALAPKTAKGKVHPGDSVQAKEAARAVEMEFGDVLFCLVNVARHMGIDSESALRVACNKFRTRWSFMEEEASEQGIMLEESSFSQLDDWWEQAKDVERY